MQLFLDLDGVLADFDRGHELLLGHRPNKTDDNVDWKRVAGTAGFYDRLPPMEDLPELWHATKHLDPIILTGIPSNVPDAAANKLSWVARHLGHGVNVICCLSRDKARYATPGDVLVDDWEKHRHRWEAAGGRWVTHTSAAASLAALRRLGML